MSSVGGTLGLRRHNRSRAEENCNSIICEHNNPSSLASSTSSSQKSVRFRPEVGGGRSHRKIPLSRRSVLFCLVIAGHVFFFLGQMSMDGGESIVGGGGGKGESRLLGRNIDVKTSYNTHTKADMRFESADESIFELNGPKSTAKDEERIATASVANEGDERSDNGEIDKCSFRRYPPHRYYNLTAPIAEQPPFLSDAHYIRAELPIILNPPKNDKVGLESESGHHSTPIKVCADTSEWEDVSDTMRWPFTDGHNPSLMSLAAHPTLLGINTDKPKLSDADRVRLNPERVAPLADLYGGQSELERMYLGLAVMGNGQCNWKMNEDQIEAYKFSKLTKAPDHRSLIVIFDHKLRKVGQTTIFLEQDEKFGTRRGAINAKPKAEGSGFERTVVELDDPRLFFHQGDVWILFRNGPKFGYEDQLQNRLHFESITHEDGSKGFASYIKASETVQVCCGRNMALISEEPLPQALSGASDEKPGGNVHEWGAGDDVLKALTWVDPVTVAEVDLSKLSTNDATSTGRTLRRLTEQGSSNDFVQQQHRRLGAKKSHIHGTNGYMVPLHSTGELLGIAHFHRPEKRDTSDYALHGHHYTHTFFTIGRRWSTRDQEQSPEYELKRISNEFLFRSIHNPTSAGQGLDGDIIQFASGLDLIGSDKDGKLLISYGINDCEGAAFFLDMKVLQSMLLDIGDAKEVVDLMELAKK